MASIEERLSNVHADEGTVNGSKTITFPWRTGKLIVTNDSSTTDLTLRMRNTAGQDITLKPTETLTLWFGTKTATVIGSNVPYRLWGFG